MQAVASSWRGGLWGPLLFFWFVATAKTVAQPPALEPARETPSLRPPEVLHLPDIALAAGHNDAPREVEVRIRIAANGIATLETCDAPTQTCGAIESALPEARFVPASRNGEAIPAVVGLRLRVAQGAPDAANANTTPPSANARTTDPAPSPEQAANDLAPNTETETWDESSELTFGATGRLSRPRPGALHLELEEIRDLPGTFGDPMRVLEALPGVTPILSGVPYMLVRGSPPSGSLYAYDDIPMPSLYHLGLGPSVIHPRMLGDLHLHSGVPPAQFGRLIGGVLEAEGPRRDLHGTEGELELRLLDINGYLSTPLGPGRISIGARYGYPGLLLRAFSSPVQLSYWDYQTLITLPIADDLSFEAIAFGSYDSLRTTSDEERQGAFSNTDILSEFHRGELRLVDRRPNHEVGLALRFGWERSAQGNTARVQALKVGGRFWARFGRGPLSTHIGGDVYGSSGAIEYTPADGTPLRGAAAIQNPARIGGLASAPARLQASAHGELTWRPHRAVELDLGGRIDLWRSGDETQAALDPRLRAVVTVTPSFRINLAGGVSRQPAVFYLPLPGLSDVAVDHGLQTATQGEVGIEADIGPLEVQLHAFAHRYQNLLFPDLLFESEVCETEGAACRNVYPDPRVGGSSYGAEVFLRLPSDLPVSGFLSYTLAKASLTGSQALAYTPSFDIRHVLNIAARWQSPSGFALGLRGHLRSGRPEGVWYVSPEDASLQRYEERLPAFYRIDVEASYRWRGARDIDWRVSFEWLNATLSREPNSITCPVTGPQTGACAVERLPALFAPNLSLRATFR